MFEENKISVWLVGFWLHQVETKINHPVNLKQACKVVFHFGAKYKAAAKLNFSGA